LIANKRGDFMEFALGFLAGGFVAFFLIIVLSLSVYIRTSQKEKDNKQG